MTEVQSAAAVGAVVGGMITSILVVSLIVYLLIIIAWWKIFTKAGEKGWKSIIPIYNVYILFKISGMKNYFWFILAGSLIVSIVQTVAGNEATVTGIISLIFAIFMLVVEIMQCYKLAKAFGKGVGYTLGLIFLPNIFTLILGFGKSEYVGIE